MATDDSKKVFKNYKGFTEAELKELFFTAEKQQRRRNNPSLNKENDIDADDYSDAELLLKIIADLIEEGGSIPTFLLPWIKEIFDTIAAGEDPRTVAFTAKASRKGHRPSHDDDFIKYGTTKHYRIAAIVQLLILGNIKKGMAIRIVADALLDSLASDKFIRSAVDDWANLGISEHCSSRDLRSFARGNGLKESDEFVKVVDRLRELDLPLALAELVGN